jgi:ribosomal protein S18 acetylase RimI-like enzyme
MNDKNDKIKIVDNEPKYWEFIRKLRLNPECKDGFIEQEKITPEQQIKYMQKRGNDFKICLVNGEPAGYMRVIDQDISIAVSPEYRKKGIGLFMINELMKEEPNAFAKIKTSNTASIKLFEKAGFKLKYLHYEKPIKNRKLPSDSVS